MHHVLIVDDESGIRESLSGVLEDEGYKASTAHSAEECLELLRKSHYDVVLLDIWLPGMDGLEALEKIKEFDDRPEVVMAGFLWQPWLASIHSYVRSIRRAIQAACAIGSLCATSLHHRSRDQIQRGAGFHAKSGSSIL